MNAKRKARAAWACWLIAAMALVATTLWAGDWTQWGGSDARNMVSAETGLLETFDPVIKQTGTGGAASKAGQNIKWVAKLGSESYGNPTVFGGKVFIGTNNDSPRDPRFTGDRCNLMCFDEASGKYLWQLSVRKLPQVGTFNADCPKVGICSSPTVDGNRVYIVTNRCDVLCLTTEGLGKENVGPFVDEGRYALGMPDLSDKVKLAMAKARAGDGRGRGRPATTPATGAAARPAPANPDPPGDFNAILSDPVKLGLSAPGEPPKMGPGDADIVWRFNMARELDIWVQDACDCSVLMHGDYLYVTTSNGVDRSHKKVPSPDAPALIVLNKKTGKLVAVEKSGICSRLFHGTWSSPSLGEVGGRTLVFFGGPDGFCYAFDAEPVPGENGQPGVLKEVWRYDCNPPDYRQYPYNRGPRGPSEIIGTPAFHKDRVYVTVGQDPRHGKGPGMISCIDATKTGDITKTGKVWSYALDRSLSTPSIQDGLLYVGDFSGNVSCFDPDTGERYWIHDTKAPIWSSTLAADGKVYIGTGKGDLWVFAAGKELKVLSTVKLGSPMYNTPIVANGVLYVASNTHLYAVCKQ